MTLVSWGGRRSKPTRTERRDRILTTVLLLTGVGLFLPAGPGVDSFSSAGLGSVLSAGAGPVLSAGTRLPFSPTPLVGQEIPREEYIRFVPLEHPRLVRATAASRHLQLFGDPSDPGYRDRSPRNGIDDRLDPVLLRLGRRFAPILVQNTTAFPMDFQRFIDRAGSFPLHVDTWNLAGPEGKLVRSDRIDLAALAARPCPEELEPVEDEPRTSEAGVGGRTARDLPADAPDDCRLLALLREFHPERPRNEAFLTRTVDPGRQPFRVLFLDFPGRGEESWKEEYIDPETRGVPERYAGFAKIYLHPFLREVGPAPREGAPGPPPREDAPGPPPRESAAGTQPASAPGAASPRYELVLQYWFFYPFNDGGNNHEGDWEHINVVVAPRETAGQPLAEAEVRAILRVEPELFRRGGDRELVISRVDYYFHHQVMTLDYARPNVYLPEPEWRAEVDALARRPDPALDEDPTARPSEARIGQRWIWSRIRERAYRDASFAPDAVNTHPVAFIGADNKGLDQLLIAPGGKNRDSHGTFPFPGLYKDVGPAGASEEIGATFDHAAYLADPTGRGGVWTVLGPRAATHGTPLSFWEDPEGIGLLPDWERVLDLVHTDPEARRRWAWLVLPIRWGWPAVESPLAGVVAHAETGNLAPVGPAHNAGWNRVGASAGYHAYEPHRFWWLTPLSWRDSFQNELGFLNLTLPTISNLPPFDLAWRVLAAPIRAALGSRPPVFYPRETVPFRFASAGAGISWQILPDDFGALLLTEPVFAGEVADRIGAEGGTGGTGGTGESAAIRADDVRTVADGKAGWAARVTFFAGKKFSSENALRHLRTGVGATVGGGPVGGAATGGGAGVPDGAGDQPPTPGILRADLNFWELAGSLRYNLATDAVQPYAKAGYAWSWYRLEGLLVNGAPASDPNSEWFQRPSLTGLDNLLPNTWHLGAGIEVIPRRSYAALPAGVDLGLRLEYGIFFHGLGAELSPELAGALDRDVTVTRHALDIVLTLGF